MRVQDITNITKVCTVCYTVGACLGNVPRLDACVSLDWEGAGGRWSPPTCRRWAGGQTPRDAPLPAACSPFPIHAEPPVSCRKYCRWSGFETTNGERGNGVRQESQIHPSIQKLYFSRSWMQRIFLLFGTTIFSSIFRYSWTCLERCTTYTPPILPVSHCFYTLFLTPPPPGRNLWNPTFPREKQISLKRIK